MSLAHLSLDLPKHGCWLSGQQLFPSSFLRGYAAICHRFQRYYLSIFSKKHLCRACGAIFLFTFSQKEKPSSCHFMSFFQKIRMLGFHFFQVFSFPTGDDVTAPDGIDVPPAAEGVCCNMSYSRPHALHAITTRISGSSLATGGLPENRTNASESRMR